MRMAAKAVGYADGSRCPSAGRIFSVAEQARSFVRYRESGQDGPEELVIYGCMYTRHRSRIKNGLWGGSSSMAGDPRVLHPRLIQQFSQPDVKCLPGTRDVAARELKRRDTFFNQPAREQ